MAMDTDTRRAFLQALDEDAEFRQEVRNRLLSRELMELPEKFADFTAKVNDFMAYVNDFMAHVNDFMAYVNDFIEEQKRVNAEFRADIAELKGDFAELKGDVSELKVSYKQLDGRLGVVENQLKRIGDDVGMLKGNVAFYAARDRFELILEQLGLDYVNMLSRQELIDMVRRYGSERIEFSDRRSFYAADLVLEARDGAGDACYVVLEASYTADRRDTDRVSRNAEYLTLFTGCPAHGIIASVDNDRDIQPLFQAGTLQWFQLQPEDLQPQ